MMGGMDVSEICHDTQGTARHDRGTRLDTLFLVYVLYILSLAIGMKGMWRYVVSTVTSVKLLLLLVIYMLFLEQPSFELRCCMRLLTLTSDEQVAVRGCYLKARCRHIYSATSHKAGLMLSRSGD